MGNAETLSQTKRSPLLQQEDEKIKDTKDLYEAGRKNVLRDITPIEWEDLHRLANGEIGGTSSLFYMQKFGYQKFIQIMEAIRDDSRNIESDGARVVAKSRTPEDVLVQVSLDRTQTWENLKKLGAPIRNNAERAAALRVPRARRERRVGADNATRNRFFTTAGTMSAEGAGVFGDHWHPAFEEYVSYGQPQAKYAVAFDTQWHGDDQSKFNTDGERVGDKFKHIYHASYPYQKQKMEMESVFRPMGLIRYSYQG